MLNTHCTLRSYNYAAGNFRLQSKHRRRFAAKEPLTFWQPNVENKFLIEKKNELRSKTSRIVARFAVDNDG